MTTAVIKKLKVVENKTTARVLVKDILRLIKRGEFLDCDLADAFMCFTLTDGTLVYFGQTINTVNTSQTIGNLEILKVMMISELGGGCE